MIQSSRHWLPNVKEFSRINMVSNKENSTYLNGYKCDLFLFYVFCLCRNKYKCLLWYLGSYTICQRNVSGYLSLIFASLHGQSVHSIVTTMVVLNWQPLNPINSLIILKSKKRILHNHAKKCQPLLVLQVVVITAVFKHLWKTSKGQEI